MKTFKKFIEDTRKDALKRALAMHRFKQKGGTIDKQPPSLDLGKYKYRGLKISTLSKDDQERVKAIAQYRKDAKMKAKHNKKHPKTTYGRGKKGFSLRWTDS